jgi:hypothetical protein
LRPGPVNPPFEEVEETTSAKIHVYLSDEVSISTSGALHNIVVVKIAHLAGFFLFSATGFVCTRMG